MTRLVFSKIYNTIHSHITEMVKCMSTSLWTNFLSDNQFFYINRLQWGFLWSLLLPHKKTIWFSDIDYRMNTLHILYQKVWMALKLCNIFYYAQSKSLKVGKQRFLFGYYNIMSVMYQLEQQWFFVSYWKKCQKHYDDV